MQDSLIIRLVIKITRTIIRRGLGQVSKDDPTYQMMVSSATNTPLRNLTLVKPDSMPRQITSGLVHLANGRILKGILTMITPGSRNE